MRLEPTENPAPASRAACSRRRLVAGVLVTVAGSSVLVSCSTGSSREAERGRRQDAERTSVVDHLQATRTAELVRSTPESTAGSP